MLAQMDDRVRAELVPQPEIEGEVAVRRVEVGRVVGGGRVDVVAARRLEADHHVAQRQQRQREGAGHDMRVAPRAAPSAPRRAPRTSAGSVANSSR